MVNLNLSVQEYHADWIASRSEKTGKAPGEVLSDALDQAICRATPTALPFPMPYDLAEHIRLTIEAQGSSASPRSVIIEALYAHKHRTEAA